MWERRVVQHCRHAELLYYLDLVLVGLVIAQVVEEVDWIVIVVVVDVELEGVFGEWVVEDQALSSLVAKVDSAFGVALVAKAWKHTNFAVDTDTEYSMEEIGIALMSCLVPWVAMVAFGP